MYRSSPSGAAIFVGEVSADRPVLWVGASDQFGLVPAQRDGVVPVPLTRRPRGFLMADRGGDGARVGQRRHRHRRVDRAQPRLVRQQRTDGDMVLPLAANSGQYVATGSSYSNSPRVSVGDGERRRAPSWSKTG